MIWAYLGTALFLVPALALAAREGVPRPHDAGVRQAAPHDAPGDPAASASLASAPAHGAAARCEPAVGNGRASLPTATPVTVGGATSFVIAGALAVATGVAIVGRWWVSAPVFATVAIGVLPILTALAAVDVSVQRLPNRLTGRLAVVTVAGLGIVALAVAAGANEAVVSAQGPAVALRRAALGALMLGVFYLALALLGGGSGMGLGDVKLAPSLGALMAWAGWDVWLAGAFAAFLLGGVWGAVLMLRGQGRHARMPFGPFMITGALAALVLA